MNKSLFGIGILLMLITPTFADAINNQPAKVLPPGGAAVHMFFSPTSATSGTSVTLSWAVLTDVDVEVLGCYILGVPGIQLALPNGSFTFSASQNLNAVISCDVTGGFLEEPYVVGNVEEDHIEDFDTISDVATFTLIQSSNLDFDLAARHSNLTGARYSKIDVVNPVDVRYCDGDGILWIESSRNYNVTCYDANGGSKSKNVYLTVN
jgi:hypothetical protein